MTKLTARTKTLSVLSGDSVVACLLLLCQSPASGQSAEPEGFIEEIVVTARKRDERLLDAPLAITAYTADTLEKLGLQDIEDVSLITTGMQFHKQAGVFPGRVNSALRFRALHVNSEIPTFQLGSVFIDGVYVLGSVSSVGLEDIERVEVIKGPQAAYFGRNTFGGAINLITRIPGNSPAGRITASAEEFGDYQLNVSYEGPAIKDKLSYRVAVRGYGKGAQYVAQDGGNLGEEQSRSIAVSLYGTPSPKLEYKLRAYYGEDDDGPAAGTFISGTRFDTCTGTTAIDPATGQTVARQRYICGRIPGPDDLPPGFISTNTVLVGIDTLEAAGVPNLLLDVYFANSTGDQSLDVGPSLNGLGVAREMLRLGLSGSYEFDNRLTLTSTVAYNSQLSRVVSDFDLTPVGSWWAGEGRDFEDNNVEIRLSSDTSGRFQWLVGVNRYDQEIQLNGTGGVGVTPCFISFPPDPPLEDFPCIASPFVSSNSLGNTDSVTTLGWFAGVDIALTEQLSLILEGRLQRDEVAKGQFLDFTVKSEETTFLPRIILQLLPRENTNVYLSYARGVLPGDINSAYAFAPEIERQQYEEQIAGIADFTQEELLDSYEIGWKQAFSGRRGQLALALYWMDWSGQKARSSALIFEDPDGDGVVNMFPARRGVTVTGDAALKGIELESSIRLSDRWDLELNINWADARYRDLLFNFVQPVSGIEQQRGNRTPRYPEWSGNLAVAYSAPLRNTDWSWYTRWDWIYFGETFADESNLARADDYSILNARAGLQNENMRIELTLKNAANEQAWAAASRFTDFSILGNILGLGSSQGIAVTPLDRRQVGLRFAYQF